MSELGSIATHQIAGVGLLRICLAATTASGPNRRFAALQRDFRS